MKLWDTEQKECISKVKEGKANKKVVMSGIVKNGCDGKDVFKDAIDP